MQGQQGERKHEHLSFPQRLLRSLGLRALRQYVFVVVKGIFATMCALLLGACSMREAGLSLNKADRALSQLRWGEFDLRAAEKMEIGVPAEVSLDVGVSDALRQARLILEDAARAELHESGPVQISDEMEAQLTGDDFAITAVTPATQLVGTQRATVWKWSVTPRNLGVQTLHLSLNAEITYVGHQSAKSIKTLSRDIHVRVSSLQGLWGFIEAYKLYLGGILTVILIPVARSIWKKKTSKSPPEDGAS